MLKSSPRLICMVHIQEGDEWKNDFWTCYGHFEYVVMLFGLINAPTIFQHLTNNVLYEYLDDFMVFYIDDVLIFSKNMEEHEQDVWLVLDKLGKVGFYVKLERCKFHQAEVKFLGYIIYEDGVHIDPYKVQTIVNWVTPTFVHDVQCFQCSTPYAT